MDRLALFEAADVTHGFQLGHPWFSADDGSHGPEPWESGP